MLSTKVYLHENYIVKVGQILTDGIFLLEGQVDLFTIGRDN